MKRIQPTKATIPTTMNPMDESPRPRNGLVYGACVPPEISLEINANTETNAIDQLQR